jgi:hypothetical protein
MVENPMTKVCPLCAETIKVAAKVCPYCRTRQTRFALLKGEIRGFFTVLAVLVVGGLILDRVFFLDKSEQKANLAFVQHKHDLTVGHTEWVAAEKENAYWLTGFVTNQGAFSWRVHELEVRIMDAQTNMLDVQHVELGKDENFVIQPGQDHAFKIQFETPLLDTNSSLAVYVKRATDGRKNYDSD